MLYIPLTNPDYYASRIVALNVISPENTGDQNSAAALSSNAYLSYFYLYGENQPKNTLHLLGQRGIIDGTELLNEMEYYPEYTPVWIADNPRACVDYLYYAVLKTGSIGRVVLDDWFPCDDDKRPIYELRHILEQYLTKNEKGNLLLWKRKNPMNYTLTGLLSLRQNAKGFLVGF